jgi:hypothetical protein
MTVYRIVPWMAWGTQICLDAAAFWCRCGCGRGQVAEEFEWDGPDASDSVASRPSACGDGLITVTGSDRVNTCTDQAHGAGVAVAVHPVRAVVSVKVLAPVLVESAAARHGERRRIWVSQSVLFDLAGRSGV